MLICAIIIVMMKNFDDTTARVVLIVCKIQFFYLFSYFSDTVLGDTGDP